MRWWVLGVWVATSGCEALRNQASQRDTRPITPEEFGEQLNDKFCDELDPCGNALECEDLTGEFEVPAHCEFNAEMAQDCLDEPWTCSGDVGGDFSFPLAPAACSFVVDCEGTVQTSPGSTSPSTGNVSPNP